MRELDKARAYAESLIKNAPDPVFVSDLEGKILQANDAVFALLGFRPDELIEQSLSRIISPEETREFLAALREVVEREEDTQAGADTATQIAVALRTDQRGVTRNVLLNPRSAAGEIIPTSLNASALRDSDGKVIGAIGILRDMRELDKARAYAESLIKNAPDPVFVSDLEGKILQANDAVSELLGFRQDEVLEQSLSRFIGPEETREFMSALDEVVERGVTRNARLHPRSASGEIIPTTLNASALRDPDGKVIGAIGVLHDMRAYEKVVRDLQESAHELRGLFQKEQAARAELDETHRELEAANRQREEFISMIAHDLGGPLTTLRGYAEILGRSTVSPEVQERARSTIISEMSRMARLVGDLADAAHLAAGQFRIHPAPCDLAEIAREQVELDRGRTERHSIRLDVLSDMPPTTCDRDRLAQVLSNLLTNAIKYAPGGEIQVRLWVEGQQARLSVSDKGPGIPPDQLAIIFEPHLRLAKDPPGSGSSGAGLGLHIAKGIIEAHHGRIWVESSQGHGATFHIALPLRSPAAAPLPEDPPGKLTKSSAASNVSSEGRENADASEISLPSSGSTQSPSGKRRLRTSD
jgi:PAS domain S-box-containing protein